MMGSIKSELFREPDQSLAGWVGLALGTSIFLYGAATIVVVSPASPEYLVMGGALAAMGGSELVPPRQVRLAAALRVLALIGFVLYAVIAYGQLR
jgi:hypothetical protein